jgi:hypothetical protein
MQFTWYQEKLINECQDIAESWFDTLKIILPFASFSYAFVVFDTMGDQYGWKQALVPAIIVFFLPMWFYIWKFADTYFGWSLPNNIKQQDRSKNDDVTNKSTTAERYEEEDEEDAEDFDQEEDDTEDVLDELVSDKDVVVEMRDNIMKFFNSLKLNKTFVNDKHGKSQEIRQNVDRKDMVAIEMKEMKKDEVAMCADKGIIVENPLFLR